MRLEDIWTKLCTVSLKSIMKICLYLKVTCLIDCTSGQMENVGRWNIDVVKLIRILPMFWPGK